MGRQRHPGGLRPPLRVPAGESERRRCARLSWRSSCVRLFDGAASLHQIFTTSRWCVIVNFKALDFNAARKIFPQCFFFFFSPLISAPTLIDIYTVLHKNEKRALKHPQEQLKTFIAQRCRRSMRGVNHFLLLCLR